MEVYVKVRVAVVAALAVATLTACGNANAGSAAIVNGKVIAQSMVTSEINDTRREIQSLPSSAVAQAPSLTQVSQMIVDRYIMTELLDVAMAEKNVTVTPAEVTALLGGAYKQYGEEAIKAQLVVQSAVPSAQIENFGHNIVAQQKLMKALDPTGDQTSQTKALSEYLTKLVTEKGVTVNPRYGDYNPSTLTTSNEDNVLSSLGNTMSK